MGKKNKSKKFLRQKHNKKHNANPKHKQDQHAMMDATNKKESPAKKAKHLFNAGINALDEQPVQDAGLFYHKSDAHDADADAESYEHDYDDTHDSNGTGGGGHALNALMDGSNSMSGDFGSEWSDVMSLQSDLTILDDVIQQEHLVDNEIDDLLDSLVDNDSNVRIKSLKTLNNDLRLCKITRDDMCGANQRLQLLCKYLAISIRRGSVNEKLHALDAVGLLSLALTESLDFVMKYFQSLVKSLITHPKSGVVQVKAIHTWAIMTWSGGEAAAKLSAIKLFEFFWNYNLKDADSDDYESGYQPFSHDDDTGEHSGDSDASDADESKDEVRASSEILTEALDAWLFLITSIGSPSEIGTLLDSYSPALLRLLRLGSTKVMEKIYIGKALTVLIDNYSTALQTDPEFEEQEVNLIAIMAEFKHLKSDAKQHKKKEFLVQKAKFRDYLKTLEHKWTPIVRIKLHHRKFEVAGWNEWIQFHAVKKLLLNGLQAHLLLNHKLKEAFDIDVEAEPVILSKYEKKHRKKENFEHQRNLQQKRGRNRDKKRGFMFDKALVQ